MITPRSLLFLSIWIAVSATVIAAAEEVSGLVTKQEQASESLEGFIDDAVDAGLLSLPGDTEETVDIESSDESGSACLETYPLDFSEYQTVRLYRDIAPYRGAVSQEHDSHHTVELIKAYLALGLYAEAIAVQDKDRGFGGGAYTAVAELMDGYRKADDGVFRNLANCHPQAGLWLGINLLVSGDITGADILDRHVRDFRNLPLQLRSNVGAIVLPTLRYNERVLLGKKLLATFSQQEIKESSRLSIQAAFLEVSAAHADGSQAAYDFLSRTSPSMDELFASVGGETFLGDAQKAIVLEEAYKVLERSTDHRDIATALQFALEGLKDKADYTAVSKLIELPSLAAPTFQLELKEHLAARFIADLEGEAHLAKLLVVDMLVNNPDIISEHDKEDKIISAAVDFVRQNDQAALAHELLQTKPLASEDVVLSARLAYRQDDLDALYELVTENMDHPDVVYWGALAAVENNNADMVGQLEGHLAQEVGPLLVLAEADALAGGWLLTEKSYEVVRRLGQPEQLVRLEQVLSLKALKELSEEPVFSVDSQGIRKRLVSSGAALGQLQQEDG